MIRLGIAAESRGDAAQVSGLADRVFVEGVDWIDADVLDAYRTWCGLDGDAWLDVHGAYRVALERGLQPRGHFAGEAGAADALMFLAILRLFLHEPEPPRAVVLSRDTDGDEERRRGFEQATTARQWPFEVVGAIAHPELEAWLVAAWTPETPEDHQRLAQVRARLGFDPTAHPERLTAGKPTQKKDAKRVLGELVGHGEKTEALSAAPIEALVERGRGCGLADFVADVRSRLVPLAAGRTVRDSS